MKTISSKKTKALRLDIDKFEGIDSRFTHSNPKGSSDIVNFRILPDGSLKKRYGYRILAQLEYDIRAMWSGIIDGKFTGFVLVREKVKQLDFETGALTDVGTVNSYDSEAQFFYYQSSLYLVDGYRIYLIRPHDVSFPHGYIPLVGKDWRDTYRGAPYERRNLLNNKGRITYVISDDPSVYLKTDEEISSIDLILINGEVINNSRYSITAMSRTVAVEGMEPGDRVEMFFTYANFPYTEAYEGLLTNTRAMVFGGINNFRPFLWGGRKGMMYTAAYVSEDALAASRMCDSRSDALYFPVGYEFTVGDGASEITAVSRHYDRLLIFNENGAWMANSSSCGVDDFPVLNINSHAGVLSQGAAAMLGNRPCTVGQTTIYRWTSSTDEFDECNAYSISEQIDGLLPPDFYKSATVFSDTARGELYFCSPALGDVVWVYSEKNGSWVRFNGISADRFISCGDEVGFIRGKTIYVFDKSLTVDMPEAYTAQTIRASYTSNSMTFDTDGKKRLYGVTLCGSGGSPLLCVALNGQDGYPISHEMALRGAQCTVTRRTRSTRFENMLLAIYCEDNEPTTIRSVSIQARLKD